MSSKNDDRPQTEAARLALYRSWSITTRLVVLYTLLATAVLVLSSGFLYWVLKSNLIRGDERFLRDKVEVLRTIIRDHGGELDLLKEEVQWEVAAYQFTQYYARVLEGAGDVRIETPDMSRLLPVALFPSLSDAESERSLTWNAPDERFYLLLSAAAGEAGSGSSRRVIQVALDVTAQEALLSTYRRTLGIVLLLAILCSAGAGALVARQGMRPLYRITSAVERVTAAHLDERLYPSRWPAELTVLALAFDEMLGRLEDAFDRLARFSADLAHELRTPINNLMGEAEVALARPRTPEEYRHVLESSLEEYARLARMIENLLFLARADNTEVPLSRSTFAARCIADEVREVYEAVAEEAGVQVSCRGEALLEADPMLFRRALSNVLSNALRYTPSGGHVEINISAQEYGAVEIEISDTGCGISPEHLPRLLERFYRTDHARSHYPEGTGLGLPIVKSIMELHGGAINIQSDSRHGTTVTLHFPAPESNRFAG